MNPVTILFEGIIRGEMAVVLFVTCILQGVGLVALFKYLRKG